MHYYLDVNLCPITSLFLVFCTLIKNNSVVSKVTNKMNIDRSKLMNVRVSDLLILFVMWIKFKFTIASIVRLYYLETNILKKMFPFSSEIWQLPYNFTRNKIVCRYYDVRNNLMVFPTPDTPIFFIVGITCFKISSLELFFFALQRWPSLSICKHVFKMVLCHYTRNLQLSMLLLQIQRMDRRMRKGQ